VNGLDAGLPPIGQGACTKRNTRAPATRRPLRNISIEGHRRRLCHESSRGKPDVGNRRDRRGRRGRSAPARSGSGVGGESAVTRYRDAPTASAAKTAPARAISRMWRQPAVPVPPSTRWYFACCAAASGCAPGRRPENQGRRVRHRRVEPTPRRTHAEVVVGDIVRRA